VLWILVEHDLVGKPESTFPDHALMPARPVRIGRSETGLGLFATKAIARGVPIVSYRGPRIPTAHAHERERRFGAKYMFELNRRWTIDGSPRWNLGRYANHSCRPNTEPVARSGRVKLVALRPILPGEEITFDYGEEYFALFFKNSGCRCADCRVKAARRRARVRRR
jgi:SET domain-containing protein